MSSASTTLPPIAPPGGLYRFSVDDYHKLIETGVLHEDARVELLEGYLVLKMPNNPPHGSSIQRTWKRLVALTASGWDVRIQLPVTFLDSEPEPDVAVARGADTDYGARHPGPAELGLVVEVSDSSLTQDRTWKRSIYEGVGIPVYWIINVPDRQVEVYPLTAGTYGPPLILTPGQMLPLVLDGVHLGDIPVADLFV
jgi:Uma2 family endonuclease